MNALTLARGHGVRGAALWALGMEDASVWNNFGRHDPVTPDLTRVVVPNTVDFAGSGELLRVVRRPQAGSRTLETDPATGLITDESYTAFPSGWLVERSGEPEKTIALTFDDGPDPVWTPKILDVLKKEGVKATFFMIGQQVADQPDLVRRVYAEGHEIGSHSFTHPNMAHSSQERVRLELSAAQRAFEAVLGRSVVLFRPPFNADSEPRTYGEIMPIAIASEQGYVVAGETIDPNDWDTVRRTPDGRRVRLTGGDIEQVVLSRLDFGDSVLLHDGGGDRSATLAALPDTIRQLKARGYRFATIGELENHGRDATMPPIPIADRWYARVDAVAFEVRRVGGLLLFWAFSLAIVLGLVRIALMIGLAAKPAPARFALSGRPRVDVLVAAYNEATVIARTVRSILASSGVDVRVIVVDDGSSDGTGDVVEREFRRRSAPVAPAQGERRQGVGAQPRPVAVGRAGGGGRGRRHAAGARCPGQDRRILRGLHRRRGGGQREGGQPLAAGHALAVAGVHHQPERRPPRHVAPERHHRGAGGHRRLPRRGAACGGGYGSDTLAEDMDLTWRLRRAGWRIVNESRAHAYTEAPETLGALMRQRFRWSFGTLQCLWKHRRATFHYGWFGWLALPTLWVFQFAAQVLAPFVDLGLLAAGVGLGTSWYNAQVHQDMPMAPDPMIWVVVAIYVAFMALEVLAGWVAYEFDDEDKRELWLLPTQRFVYRQIMYLVVWRSLLRAGGGAGARLGQAEAHGRGARRPRRAGGRRAGEDLTQSNSV